MSLDQYGLVYPGIGWALWKNEEDVPSSLVTETNVLGFVEKSFSLNFSRGGAMILAQYYNFVRMGWKGYYEIQNTMRETARYLASELEKIGRFDILNNGKLTPSCIAKLKDTSKYNEADLVSKLKENNWIIPAFTMPPDADSVTVMRMNVKETFSRDMADLLISDILKALEYLDAVHSKPYCKPGTHHH